MAWKRYRILAGLPTALLLLVMAGCGGSSEPEENLVVDLSDPSVTGPGGGGGGAGGGAAPPPPPPPGGQGEAQDRGGRQGGGNLALRPRGASEPDDAEAPAEESDSADTASSGGDQALNEMLGAFNASGGGQGQGQAQGPGGSGGGPGPGMADARPGGGQQQQMMGGSGGMDQQAMMRERMGGGQEEMMAQMMGNSGGDPSEMMAQRMGGGQNQAQMMGPGGFGEGFGPGGAGGGPAGPGGFGPGGSSDEPIDFDNPVEVVEAFIAAAEDRDMDRLQETTALRAPYEAGNEQRKELFQKIRELSLSQEELDGIGKDLEEYSIVAVGQRRSSGTINYVLRKTLDNGDVLQRAIIVRKEKAGWKVVDVKPPWLNDRPNQNRRRGR